MFVLFLTMSTYLFSCDQANQVISNVWQNEYLTRENQIGIIEEMLEVTPPECPAHHYNE